MEYEQVKRHAILIILEESPITLHRRDSMDTIKAGRIFDRLYEEIKCIRIEADNQDLPRIEFDEIKDYVIGLSTDDYAKVLAIMSIWIGKIKKAGFVKVIKKEEK